MRIIVAGDYSPLFDLQETLDRGEFESVFGNLRPILNDADYSVVNFETTLADDQCKKIKKSGPHLKTNENAVKALKYAGFNCVTLANNHFRDYGDRGVKLTIDALEQEGIDYVGGGNAIDEAAKTLYKGVAGKKFAIINACEHEFSIAEGEHGGSNPLDLINQYNAIIEAKIKADYVIVIIHGGHEHYNLPSIRMKKTYRFFIDAGADAVINHHQHCWSGYEVYNEKPIFYGLGNFCFPNLKEVDKPSFWNYGYMVILEFGNNGVSFDVLPYSQCFKGSGIEPINNGETFEKEMMEINKVIQDDNELMRRMVSLYSKDSRKNRYLWEPYRGKLLKGLYYFHLLPNLVTRRGAKLTMLYNLLNCESHRDRMMYLLKGYIK